MSLVTVVARSVGDAEPDAAPVKGGPIAHPVWKGLLSGVFACLVLSCTQAHDRCTGIGLRLRRTHRGLAAARRRARPAPSGAGLRGDPRAPASRRLKLATVRLLKAGSVALTLAGLLVVAETLAPHNESLVQMAVRVPREDGPGTRKAGPGRPGNAVKAQQAQAQAQAAEEQTWADASFLLTSPGGYALAIRRDGDDTSPYYKVVAKGRETEAQAGQKIAWQRKNPIVANDPALTIRIYQEVKTGKNLPEPLAEAVTFLWKPKTFLPADAPIVAFDDLVLHRRRTGFVLDGADEDFGYCDLIPMRARRRPPAARRSSRRSRSSASSRGSACGRARSGGTSRRPSCARGTTSSNGACSTCSRRCRPTSRAPSTSTSMGWSPTSTGPRSGSTWRRAASSRRTPRGERRSARSMRRCAAPRSSSTGPSRYSPCSSSNWPTRRSS